MFIRSLASLCLAAACSLALAQGAVHYKENEQVDPQEVARILRAEWTKQVAGPCSKQGHGWPNCEATNAPLHAAE